MLLEELADSIGVIGSGLQAAEDENFERALKEFEALPLIVYGRHAIGDVSGVWEVRQGGN